MAAIDSAYQYYLTNYAGSTTSRYDTHKKSQLRTVYNNIVKKNKESPLYKIKDTGEAQKYAIDIKERARSIQNVVASLSDAEDDAESAFAQRIAQSSDEDAVSAEYIGNKQTDRSTKFDVEVKQLATTQVNLGNYLAPDKADLEPGTYSFDLTTAFSSYEFQFNVGGRDTNHSVQEKLMRLINNAGIGLHAGVVSDRDGSSALRIESKQTGLGENETAIFEILPSPDSKSMSAMKVLGINHVEQEARNSSFLLNGVERSSLSNTFTVNNAFELTLKGPSRSGIAAQIGFKTDADAIADNVLSLVNAYNNIIELGREETETGASGKLLNDMSGVAREFHEPLDAIGIHLEENGSLSVDRDLLSSTVSSGAARAHLSSLNDFKDALSDKAANAAIDPMNYVNKIVVAYKNPAGHNYATPYITSIYSGMMLDHFC